MPITNRSQASVKNPMPETNMILIWNRLIFESSSESRRSDLGGGDATNSRESGGYALG